LELFRESIQASPDPFRRALELSLAANIFDSEFREEVDPGFSLRALLKNDSPARFAPSVAENLEDFRDAVERSQRILFVHDSAGELAFDRLAIETLGQAPEQAASVAREAPGLAHASQAVA